MSLTGDWGTDCAVNDRHLHSGRSVPVLYGWTEPHACAGHALAITGKGGCLECGFSKVGVAYLEVTAWKSEGGLVLSRDWLTSTSCLSCQIVE